MDNEPETFISPEVHEAMRDAAHARHEALVKATPIIGAITGKSESDRLSDHRAVVDRVYGSKRK